MSKKGKKRKDEFKEHDDRSFLKNLGCKLAYYRPVLVEGYEGYIGVEFRGAMAFDNVSIKMVNKEEGQKLVKFLEDHRNCSTNCVKS